MSILKIVYQTLCVFSQMKDTKHISQDYHSVTWVMPKGWDFGVLGGAPGGQKKIYKHGHVAIYGDDEQNRMKVNFSC